MATTQPGPHAHEHPVELTPVEARQGFLGRPVFYVLATSLILAMIAWGVAEMYGTAIDKTPEDAPAVTPPATTQGTFDNNPPVGEKQQPAPAEINPTAPANE